MHSKNNFFRILVLALLILSCDQKKVEFTYKYVDHVDPFIATASDHGQTDPAAAVPFGMAKPAPDTYPVGHSGYDFDATEILGFSNTRFSGVGCRGVGGNIRILPLVLDNLDAIPSRLKMDKTSENATPGYYHVSLANGISCQLSATQQVGFHKYTFPKSEKAVLQIDLASSFSKFNFEKHELLSISVVTGEIAAANVCDEGNYKFYFAIGTNKNDIEVTDEDSILTYHFKTANKEEIMVYCALSTVSRTMALEHLKKSRTVSFDTVVENARRAWEDMLQVVSVETDDLTQKRLFYTHLYHALQTPFKINEPDGSYVGSDGKVYQTERPAHYHGWSIWDTFRSKLPLFSLLYPNTFQDLTVSLKTLYKQGKVDWATQKEPFLTVRTEHAIIVLLDAHRKGLLSFSLKEIYTELKQEALQHEFESPDAILESSYDLWALSQIAGELGYSKDAKKYNDQALQYKTIWKDKFLIMDDKSDIMHGDGLYEGTLWQYRWFVPFDIKGIQNMMGGPKVFEAQLDEFFEKEYFNIGNQPDIQVPYLYAYTTSPWKTQRLMNNLLTKETNNWYGTHEKWENPITRKIFQDNPAGFLKEMDDDAGTMSSWYVWSAMGLYPVFPGDTKLVISTPLFDKITIKTEDKTIVITSKKNSERDIYIQKASFNGEELQSCFIDFNRLAAGGILKIELGETPNKTWGILN